MIIRAERVIEVPINSAIPKPYILHIAKDYAEALDNKTGNLHFNLALNIEFHDVAEFFNALRDVHSLYQQRS